jgi:hypothetical protein
MGFNPYNTATPYGTDPKLRLDFSSCSSLFVSSFTSWYVESGIWDTITSNTDAPDHSSSRSFLSANSLTTAAVSSSSHSRILLLQSKTFEFTVVGAGIFTFLASKSCCMQCTVFGGDVQVYHWPTSADSITTLINIDGYTL